MDVTVCSCTITTTVDPRKSKSVTHLLVFCCSSILIGLSHNTQVKNLDLNLSTAALGAGGSQALECTGAHIKCISSLDISDNGSSLLTLPFSTY